MPSSLGLQSTKFVISTIILERTLTFLSSVWIHTKKIRPGEPLSVESAESLIMAMFFDPRRYDLAKVGRYKFNPDLVVGANTKRTDQHCDRNLSRPVHAHIFVINGAERVIVSQLVRSPGIYYGIGHDKIGKRLFSATVIPNRGAWLASLSLHFSIEYLTSSSHSSKSTNSRLKCPL